MKECELNKCYIEKEHQTKEHLKMVHNIDVDIIGYIYFDIYEDLMDLEKNRMLIEPKTTLYFENSYLLPFASNAYLLFEKDKVNIVVNK